MTRQAIICVDDETAVLRSLKAELKEAFGEDYFIEIAESGHDALELLEELLNEHYEVPLIISDYIMPDMKGDELLRRVHLCSPKTLKVMLTGQATIEAVANAVKYAKLYRYIAKPWQAEDLRLTVQEAINSYFQDKALAEKNRELLQVNQALEQSNRGQAALIAELNENQNRLKQFNEQLSQLNQAFSRFVPRQFIHLLDKKSILDIQLGDHTQQEMSVLFADIRSFTSLSERMTPEDNFKFINAFLKRMEPVILENDGFIDKYIGDEIMALFSGSADDALNAGIGMLRRLSEYNHTRQRPERPPIKIGVGINTGCLMLGTVGGKNRMDGTVISDTVNSAARVEELTKQYGVSLLISGQTYSRLQNPAEYAIRMIDKVKVKGKSELVTVYEVFEADSPPIRAGKLATEATFTRALIAYNQQDFEMAAQGFRSCLQHNPSDQVAHIYLERCQQYCLVVS
ncbi:MAG: response regulator [Cyanothece sp. SIO1E1]|nr:response regulator [Cyanothece sp. SIO1E1]